jgi:hypothetical protein
MLSHAHRGIGKVVISYHMEEAGEVLCGRSGS